jgi:2,4-dienoyl-CoA reductase-like NADH-dependent reductase (Old Yellow Enzyme family)
MARGDYFKFPDLAALRGRVASLGLEKSLGLAEAAGPNAIAKPLSLSGVQLSNRIAMHPMEGWDADPEKGTPTPDVLRRWARMGSSGAGLIWGVEAMAVDFEYRANTHQLVLRPESQGEIGEALKTLREAGAGGPKQLVGAQVTCSGRYSYGRTKGTPPLLVYHHPELDKRLGAGPDTPLMTDTQMEDMVGLYIRAGKAAREAGFDFIDIKACHRYWLNETLAAKTRPGQYGGSFENRSKIFLMIVEGLQRELGKDFLLGTRLSAYDGIPHEEDPATRKEGLKGLGRPSTHATPYVWGWGVDEADPAKQDAEPLRLAKLLYEKGLKLFNITAGSPYSNPHLSRPTETPPSDGYQPSHDPLIEVAMHLDFAKAFKAALPSAVVVGTGYSYLRNYKLNAMEWALQGGGCDSVGFGRAFLSFPDEAKALLETGVAKASKGRQICNGDSSCTSGPRLGLKSGCIFDPYYAETMAEIRRRLAEQGITKK